MNRRRVATTLCIALTLVLCRVRCADAQAVSAGPYYATPSWDQKLLSSTRFVVLSNWNSEAVLDRETGLVWEKAPGAPDYANQLNWSIAHYVCTAIKAVGNRREWRLPTVQELASLLDPASTASPRPPAGHPFTVNTQSIYWSATSEEATGGLRAWGVQFGFGQVGVDNKDRINNVWCVRGGPSADLQ